MATALRDFIAQYPTRRFEKDQVILYQDEKPAAIYMVKLGYVKAYDITPNGSERIMSYAARGDIFPLGFLFENSEISKYYYAASSVCEVYSVPRDDLFNFLHTNNEACYEMCVSICGSYYHALDRLNSIEQPKATEKILHTLRFLEENYGRSGGAPTTHVEVPMKVQDLSSMVGLTRETVGAEMKKLKKAGVVTHRRWQFSINRQKLEHMIAYPFQYPRLRGDKKVTPKKNPTKKPLPKKKPAKKPPKGLQADPTTRT